MEKESPAARASADRGIKSGERGLNTKNLAQREARHARVTPAAIGDKRLGHAAFRVLCCLQSFADKDGHCRPSVTTIAKQLNLGRSTVSEHLNTLIGLGYLVKRSAFRLDGGRASNRYQVLAGCGADVAPLSDEPTGGSADNAQKSLLLPINGGAGAPVGKTDRGLSGQPITPDGPEPAGIKNRPIEQKKESPPRAHARGSAFDDDGLDAFQPNEITTAEWAAEHVPELRDVSDPAILAAFKDYHKSKGTKLVDLPAAWRQWLRKEPEFAQRRNQSARPRRNERNKPGEMIETVLNELRKYSDGC